MRRSGVTYSCVTDIRYDEFVQRVFMEYGNGVKTKYNYDQKRRWLKSIEMLDKYNRVYRRIDYDFNVE